MVQLCLSNKASKPHYSVRSTKEWRRYGRTLLRVIFPSFPAKLDACVLQYWALNDESKSVYNIRIDTYIIRSWVLRQLEYDLSGLVNIKG